MTPQFQLVLIVNALFFLVYGVQALRSARMKAEFARFGLSDNQRILTALLQILAFAGLLYGFYSPLTGLVTAAGLSLMMLVAFIVRIKIKDGFLQSAPSLLFMVLNIWLATVFYTLIDTERIGI
ncbi:MAG: DoxX family protein [Balneolia bacterium]|nr:DoxX family protein [Balneolia bacterium]